MIERVSEQLSTRERDVLRRLRAGATTAKIARDLGMAETTVIWLAGRVVSARGLRRTASELARARRSRHLRQGLLAAVAATGLVILGAAVAGAHVVPLPIITATPAPSASVASPGGTAIVTPAAGGGGSRPAASSAATPTTGSPPLAPATGSGATGTPPTVPATVPAQPLAAPSLTPGPVLLPTLLPLPTVPPLATGSLP